MSKDALDWIIVLIKTVFDKLIIGMAACFSGYSCCRYIFVPIYTKFTFSCSLVKLFFFLTSFLQWLVNHDWQYLTDGVLLGTYLSWVLLTKKLNFSHRVLTGVLISLVAINDSTFYWIVSRSNSWLAFFQR